MALRWKYNPKPKGLMRVGAGPLGSNLFEGDVSLASVAFSNGDFDGHKGWWWVAFNNEAMGITRKNTCYDPVETEKEAKEKAKEYVMASLKSYKLDNMEFDVWSNDDRELTATKVTEAIVSDSNAPYGYSKHEWRVKATTKRKALSLFRKSL